MPHIYQWFDVSREGDFTVATWQGDPSSWQSTFSLIEEKEIKSDLRALARAAKDLVVLDLREIDMFAPGNVRLLIPFLGKLFRAGGRSAIVCQPQIAEMLELLKLNKVVQLTRSVDEAMDVLDDFADKPIIVMSGNSNSS